MTSAADDLEALFDEVAAQRVETVAALPPAAKTKTKAKSKKAAPSAAPVQKENGIEHALEALHANQSGKPMYERLGGIVRLLHDSLRELGYDRSLSSVASQITDAQGRLEYIATLTEQAATKVLNTVDIGMPRQEDLIKNAKAMESRWALLFEGKLTIEDFKELAGDSQQFAKMVAESSEGEKARLLEIMMAQDFQDITGQLIKKIVTITHTVEQELAQLLRDNAPPEAKAALAAAEAKPPELMQGPSAPTAAMVQDDVDSLLADLGF